MPGRARKRGRVAKTVAFVDASRSDFVSAVTAFFNAHRRGERKDFDLMARAGDDDAPLSPVATAFVVDLYDAVIADVVLQLRALSVLSWIVTALCEPEGDSANAEGQPFIIAHAALDETKQTMVTRFLKRFCGYYELFPEVLFDAKKDEAVVQARAASQLFNHLEGRLGISE